MESVILKDIVIIFALSTLVNFVFTKIKVPNVVGYLITGVICGPHLLALIHARHEIELMAEIGVIVLLFTIGMEFSLKHLFRIRRIVFMGGFMQVTLTSAAFSLVSHLFGLDWQSAIFMGMLAALSSSALVLKLLQERSELTSNYGRTILGILIFQDLLLVPLLLLANLMGDTTVNIQDEIIILLIKAIFIIGLVYVGNKWLLPKLLHLIAMAKNQELFMMSIFLICLSVALLTSELGMSLAFGAFLAGLMISESEYSHNAFGNLIPFKDTFTSFFFVSIGMLLDISFVIANYQLVILSVILLVVIKFVIASATGFVLGHTLRGIVMVGMALSQVGEFSFILAKVGFDYHLFSDFYYQLFLAVAVITMAMTPFMMKYSLPFANALLKLPMPGFLVNGLFPLKEVEIPMLNNHLVIIGKDAVAVKLSSIFTYHDLEHVSVIFDPSIAKDKIQQGDKVVYGDAVNEPILMKAHVDTAGIVVISIGSIITTMAVIEKVRHINKNVYLLVRTKQIQNVESLYQLGADQVLPEELEITVDLLNRVLVNKQYSNKEVNRILTHIRNINLGVFSKKDLIKQPSILDDFASINISLITIEKDSPAIGKSLIELELRNKTGVTILAIKRGEDIIEHPLPTTVFKSNDIAYVLGNAEQIELTNELFKKSVKKQEAKNI